MCVCVKEHKENVAFVCVSVSVSVCERKVWEACEGGGGGGSGKLGRVMERLGRLGRFGRYGMEAGVDATQLMPAKLRKPASRPAPTPYPRSPVSCPHASPPPPARVFVPSAPPQEQYIGDRQVLLAAVSRAGLDAAAAAAVLDDPAAYTEQVKQQIARARGVGGVPFFTVEGR